MIITINQQNPIYLDQCFWRDELISGCVGILFDLDEKLLLEKDAQLPQREGPDGTGRVSFSHLQKMG
jgi:hypothetical protein